MCCNFHQRRDWLSCHQVSPSFFPASLPLRSPRHPAGSEAGRRESELALVNILTEILSTDAPPTPMNAKQLLYYLCIYMIFGSSLKLYSCTVPSLPPSSTPFSLPLCLPPRSALSKCCIIMLGIILIPPLPQPSNLQPHPSNSSVLQGVQRCGGFGRRWGGEIGEVGMSFSCAAAKWWWNHMEAGGGVCKEGNREMGGGEGKLHGSVNDFLAVQRDVKDRLTRDGVASKLMSYTFHAEKEKGKRRGRGGRRDGAGGTRWWQR